MTFTNEDLKVFVLNQDKEVVIPLDKFKAPLARLEAAEYLSFARKQRLSCLTTSCDSDCKSSSRKNLEIAEKAWRKAKGEL